MVTLCPATVSVPLRAGPVFGCTVYVTVPLPVPVCPVRSVIQLALLLAVHVQADAAVTPIGVPEPPVAPMLAVVGDTLYEHDVPASVTVICCPAIVRVPVRTEVVELAATEMLTVPLPFPLAPDVMVIQLAVVAAVHEQAFVVATVNELRVLPVDGSDSVVGFTVKEHDGVEGVDAAACVTLTV